MPRMRLFFTCLACALPLLAACGGGSTEDPPPGNENVSFALDVLPVSEDKEGVDHDLAMDFVEWLTSVATQEAIQAFRSPSGEALFFPDSVEWRSAGG